MFRGIGLPIHHNVPIVGQEAAVVADRVLPARLHADLDRLQVLGGLLDQRDQLAGEIRDIRVLPRGEDPTVAGPEWVCEAATMI